MKIQIRVIAELRSSRQIEPNDQFFAKPPKLALYGLFQVPSVHTHCFYFYDFHVVYGQGHKARLDSVVKYLPHHKPLLFIHLGKTYPLGRPRIDKV